MVGNKQISAVALSGVAMIAILPGAAWGQTAPASPTAASSSQAGGAEPTGSTLGDIVVTARRVSENLQKIPVAVTAFSGADLTQQNAQTAKDIQLLTPNLSMRENVGNPSSLLIAIRGQVQNEIISTVDPSIGVYVDGVYYARAVGLNAGLLDVARVEVLKGPQGTLFGRNTTGGALNITTGAPDLNKFGGSARADVGSYHRFDLQGVLNIPIVDDKLGIRVAAQRQHMRGYGLDLTNGRHLAGVGNYTVRGKLLWKPTDSTRITLSGEHFDLNQSGPVIKPNYVSPFGLPEIVAALSTGGCFDPVAASCPGFYRPGSTTFASYIGGKRYQSSPNLYPRIKAKTTTASLNAEQDVGLVTLHYIGAYRKVSNYNPIDLDGTPFTILQSPTFQSSRSWSHEVQASGKAFNDLLSFTTGLYAFDEKGNDGSDAVGVPLLNPLNPTSTRGLIHNRSKAVYGQADLKLAEGLKATGGIRYSVDRKSLDSRSTQAGVCSVPTELRNNPNVACSAIFKRRDSAVSYTGSIQYDLAPSALVYLKTSKGFRAGGFNLRGITVPSYKPFAPERVTDYEAGVKLQALGGRLRVNAAAFQSNYSDIQETTLVPNGAGSATNQVANAAKARIRGGELEVTALPVNGLRLSGTLGITDAKYKKYPALCQFQGGPASGTPCDRSHEPFNLVPKTTYSLSGQYSHSVPLGLGSVRLDYSHTSTIAFTPVTYTQTPDLIPFVRQRGYGTLNGRVEWTLENAGVTVALYGRNLTNKGYTTAVLDFVNAGLGYIVKQPGTPRELGVEVGFTF